MQAHPDIGTISPLGQRYLEKKLRGSQLTGEFTLSSRDDIPSASSLTDEQRDQWREIGRQALPGKVAFGVLAAGASSRMALKDLPEVCKEMLASAGKDDMPSSKALVPVYMRDSRPLTFLDLFLENVRRFRETHGISNPAVLLTSDANGDEINDHLTHVGAEGVLTFRQPLAPQIAATVEDVKAGQKNFASEEDYQQAVDRAKEWAGREVLIGKPAGHGEFLHQLVESGMLGQLAGDGIEYLSVRNIDNAAATLNDAWLTLFGYAVEQELDCLLEVCPRLEGQRGGALIQQNGQWRIAEDPSFAGTAHNASESCYINNAVAIFKLDYMYKLYNTSAEELQGAPPERLAEIADHGRQQFPVIVEAKPVALSDQSVVGAVTPETNMWESTGVVEGAKIGAFGVPSEHSVGEDFLELPRDARISRATTVRFSPTKTWDDFEDPVKRAILTGIADDMFA